MISYSDDQLCCDNHSLSRLAEEIPTPFFLFSERRIRKDYSRIIASFARNTPPPAVDYCVKANCEPGILRLIRDLGSGVMVSCGRELDLALNAGFEPHRISYHAHCKTEEELKSGVLQGVDHFHVYSPEEIHQLERLADALHRNIRISIRLSPPGFWGRRGWIGWYAKRLGFSRDQAVGIFREIATFSHLRPAGLSVHLGTQLTRPGRYRRAIRQLIRTARNLDLEGLPISEITLGGGWPSDSLSGFIPATFPAFSRHRKLLKKAGLLETMILQVTEYFRNEAGRSGLSTYPMMRIEPGRSLVGPAGVLITRILAVRNGWVFVDASRNVLPESLLVAKRTVLPVLRRSGNRTGRYFISGSTLNTMDVLAAGIKLPEVRAGDLLAFLDAGAYSLSRASRYAGSIPASYMVGEAGDVSCISEGDVSSAHAKYTS